VSDAIRQRREKRFRQNKDIRKHRICTVGQVQSLSEVLALTEVFQVHSSYSLTILLAIKTKQNGH
jgi:hypothetical protein